MVRHEDMTEIQQDIDIDELVLETKNNSTSRRKDGGVD